MNPKTRVRLSERAVPVEAERVKVNWRMIGDEPYIPEPGEVVITWADIEGKSDDAED